MLTFDDIMDELRHSDGFEIPVANEENKALEKEIQQGLKEKRKLALELQDLSDKVEAFLKHEQNLLAEQEQNQKLLTAHQSQLQTEQGMLLTTQFEEGRLKKDINHARKVSRETEQRNKSLQNEILKITENLEQLKSRVQWDKDALVAWDDEMTRGEEDNSIIIKYMREDDHTAKELELKRQQLKMELDERTHLLTDIMKETAVLEQVLERTAHLFKKSHIERQETIIQWESSVKILHERDREINNITQEINMMQAHGREKMEHLQDQKDFYETQVGNNKELDLEINKVLCEKSKLQLELKEAQDRNEDLENEIKVVKRTLSTACNELDNQHAITKQLSQNILTKQQKISNLKEGIKNSKQRLDRINQHSTSASEHVRHLEEMVQVEEKNMNLLDSDNKRLQELLRVSEQELIKLKNEEAIQAVRIAACENSKEKLQTRETDLNKEILRQKEIIYTLDFKAQKLEHQISHVSGNQEKEDKEVFHKNILKLEEILKSKKAMENLLTSQMLKQEDIMRRLSATLANDGKELELLKERLKDQILIVERGQKEFKVHQMKFQELQIQENLLNLHIKHLANAFKTEGNEIYSLERQKLELDLAMKERKVEIQTAKEYLMSQRRRLTESKSHLFSEIQEHMRKTEQLQNRYDILISSLGQGDNREPLSVTYFILQNVQEKHILQQEGDELDAKIQQAEKEILAMENTLKVVNAANDKYKKHLDAVEDSTDYEEMKELESEYHKVLEKSRILRNNIKELNNTVKEMETNLEQMNKSFDNMMQDLESKEAEIQNLDKELEGQSTKIQRAERQLKKLKREIYSSSSEQSCAFVEKEIETRILKEKNQTVLQDLALLTELHLELGPIVKRYLAEKNLTLPSHSYSRLSGRSSCTVRESVRSASNISDAADRSSTVGSMKSQSSSVMSPTILTLDPSNLKGAVSKSSSRNISSKKHS